MALTDLWLIIPLVLAVRRLPYTVRSAYSSLLVVHRSMEEAAASILLALPGRETMTVGSFSFYTSGVINQAAALGIILIVVGAASLFAINRLAATGSNTGGFFG
ncbi:MAG: hypothetical protein QME79_05775 [Bacillota bacterium]|nr:hypothetical protein [Bacillota bacterium]